MTTDSDEEQPAYSRAFEKLVLNSDDVVGLLAYATYKQAIREAAQDGRETDKSSRSLTPSLVSALRSSAEQLLTQIVNDGIAQATPDIQNTATIATLNSHHSEILTTLESERQAIISHVTEKTGFLPSFLTNLAAWFVTLLIAVSILYVSSRPSVEETIVGSIEQGEREAIGPKDRPPALLKPTQPTNKLAPPINKAAPPIEE